MIRARQTSFWSGTAAVATRAVRQIPREPEAIVPALIVPLFFFVVNVGALEKFAQRSAGIDFKAFQMPVSIIFAVTGVSRASTLVTDIQDGYFDRLLMTPVSRLALLLGLMVADFVLVVALCIPVLIVGFILGVAFRTGPVGVLALAQSLEREAQSDEEKTFLISELILELARVKPVASPGCLPPAQHLAEIRALIPDLKSLVTGGPAGPENLRRYVESVLARVGV